MADPADLTVTQEGIDVLLEWPTPVMEGATGVDVFRRSGTSDAPFDPEVDTPIATVPIEELEYLDQAVPVGDYAYQVFPVPPSIGANYVSKILGMGPLGYWQLNEASGTTAVAEAGPDGTYVGPFEAMGLNLSPVPGSLHPEWPVIPEEGTPPDVGITAPGTIFYNALDEVSVSFLVQNRNGNRSILSLTSAEGNRGLVVRTTWGAGVQIESRSAPSNYSQLNGGSLDWGGVWKHVVVTRDATNGWTVYIDGEEVTMALDAGDGAYESMVSGIVVIGGSGASGALADSFDGYLDQVAIFDYALTAAQVQEQYDAITVAA